jgi:hypothetical protein
MPITFNCPCGKTLRVPDSSAGKRAKCPLCSAVVAIPAPEPPPEPEPVFEIVEEPAAPPAPVTPAGPSPTYKKPYADEDEDEGGTYGLAAPEKPDPVTGQEARPKKLPNFRIGTDNHT